MAPFRSRTATGRTIEAGTIVDFSQAVVGGKLVKQRPDEADRELADPADFAGVIAVEFQTTGLHATNVGWQIGNKPVRSQPQRTGCVAIDQAAGKGIVGTASVQDRVCTKALDQALHLDVEPIDAEREARHHAGRQNHAEGLGGGNFRIEIGVAAKQAIVLGRRVGSDSLTNAQALGDTAGIGCGNRKAGARIGRAVETDELGSEQLLNVRDADGAVIAAANAEIADRCKIDAQLPGVGLERTAIRNLVAGIAIAAIEAEIVEEAVLNDRHFDFADPFGNVVVATDWQCWRALAAEIAGCKGVVRIDAERFLAVFDAQVDGDPVRSPRHLHAILAQLTGERGAEHLLGSLAADKAGCIEIGNRSRRWGSAEDVIGTAVNISSRQRHAADRVDSGYARIVDHIERVVEAGHRELVLVNLRVVDPAILIICIIAPGFAQIALGADQRTERCVGQIADPRPAFDVPAQQLEEALVIGRASGRIEKIDRRYRWIGTEIGIVARIGCSREIADETVDQIGRRAELAALVGGHQRIVAVDRQRVAEIARRGDLRQGAIIHEHDFHVGLDRGADFIIDKGTGGVTLIRTLEIVQRREVITIERTLGQRARAKRPDG